MVKPVDEHQQKHYIGDRMDFLQYGVVKSYLINLWLPSMRHKDKGPETLYCLLGVNANHLTATPCGSTLCIDSLTCICGGFNPFTKSCKITLR